MYMKRFAQYLTLGLVLILFATSCKKSVPEQTKYIPKDAMFVVDMDWKSLATKAATANIKWDSLFNASVKSSDDSAASKGIKMLEDFTNSGIDLESNVFVFMKMGGSMMSGQSVSGGAVAAMKDAGKFESYLKQQGLTDIKKGSNYSYITIEDALNIGWNEDVVIMAAAGNTTQGGDDKTTTGNPLAALFAQKEDESIAAIPEFVDLMAEKGDMLFWTNSSSMMSSVPLLGMTKFADLLQNSYGAGVINFDNGKLTGNFKSYSGKDLAAIWDKYKGPVANMDMINQYPAPVTGFASFSFNPQILVEIIRFGGMEATANQYMEKLGFTLDDITKAFKGEFAIAFSDIAIKETEMEYEGVKLKTKAPTGHIIINAAIGDKAAYDKIVAKLAEMGEMEMVNGQYVPTGMGTTFSWNMNGKNLIISGDSSFAQQYISGKGNAAIPADIAAKCKDKSMALYFDLSKLMELMPADSANATITNAAKATFKNIVATSDNFNGKYVASNFELNTANASENSLASLLKFFAASANKIRQEQRKFNQGMMGMSDFEMEDEPAAEDIIAPPVIEEQAK
ncbi:DUF4836 family protein [Panacibacter sp. KCS-6]|uniref:DUF4836 family protein n=2 Tax=Limnovirga soli TaxID=2656915 RepID=A0A8J8FCE3_9BACT|nr:DUF4836 family protein [Limnovirga soli]